MIKTVYIHGLGSNLKKSKKFTEFKNKVPNIIGFDWSQDDDLEQLIEVFINKHLIYESKSVFLIGSSSGGKIALLMKKIIKDKYDDYAYIGLLNPLANIDYVRNDVKTLITNDYLKTGDLHKDLTESVIIYSENDEVIDQKSSIKEFRSENMFVKIDDNHALSNTFEQVFDKIDRFQYHSHINW